MRNRDEKAQGRKVLKNMTPKKSSNISERIKDNQEKQLLKEGGRITKIGNPRRQMIKHIKK
jgi:hypothetical protein